MFTVNAFWVDCSERKIQPSSITVSGGRIISITPCDGTLCEYFALPGFIDAHIHIESSMMLPSEFARIAVKHGTVATVSDPHEIANVCGIEGVQYMIDNGAKVPFHFFFGAPSCVPATSFETAGAIIDAEEINTLLQKSEILYLSEMMNFPGVIHRDPEVMQKIQWAHQYHKPVDGHAPGLRGEDLDKYLAAGISTDHECFTYEEAVEKIQKGMKVLIREGSAAKNFEALVLLFKEHANHLMFCSDDKHPDELMKGHINQLAARAVAKGYNVFDVIQTACIHPIQHYKLPVGTMQMNDAADFILVEDIQHFKVVQTYINGKKVYDGECLFTTESENPINHFNIENISLSDLRSNTNLPDGEYQSLAIEAIEGQLITGRSQVSVKVENGQIAYPYANKICVVNRYKEAPISMGWIRNFNIQNGAIASSVAHDSHNIVAVGSNDEDLLSAIQSIIQMKGGIAVACGPEVHAMALPVAGLMSDQPAEEVAKQYEAVDQAAKRLTGTPLKAPYMTLSFMALPVIPSLKITDLGLFDVDQFKFVESIAK